MNSELYKINHLSPEYTFQSAKYAKAFLRTHPNLVEQDELVKFLTLYFVLKRSNFLIQKMLLQKSQCQINQIPYLNSKNGYNEHDLKLFLILQKRKKLNLLPCICLHISKQLVKRQNKVLFVVNTSRQLEDAEKQAVINFLAKQTTKEPLAIFDVDTSLISGIKIEADCFLYEKSIKSRINQTLLTLKMLAR